MKEWNIHCCIWYWSAWDGLFRIYVLLDLLPSIKLTTIIVWSEWLHFFILPSSTGEDRILDWRNCRGEFLGEFLDSLAVGLAFGEGFKVQRI